jgi:superfamily II DNA or RNA helicase
MLWINAANPRVRRLLCTTLRYSFIRHLTAWQAQQRETEMRVQVIPTDCYTYVINKQNTFEHTIYTPAGFYPKVVDALQSAGFDINFRNYNPEKNPQLFVPQWHRVRPPVTFRYMQKECIETMLSRDYACIECPTGWGKSTVIRVLCQLLPLAKFAIATASIDTLEQLYDDIKIALPTVGIVCGRKRSRPNARVTLYGLKSLGHSAHDEDILIVDEVHECATEKNLALIAKFKFARRYGFSASMKRPDNADFELEGAFGPVAMYVPYKEAVEHSTIVPISVRWISVAMDVNPAKGYKDTEKQRWGLWRNALRNEMIAAAARYFHADMQTLIMVNTLEHAVYIKKHLPEFTLCYNENSEGKNKDGVTMDDYIRWGLVPPNEPIMTRDRRRMLRKQFQAGELKKVIATPVWKRGMDFRELSVLIRADASSSEIADTQLPGRVARLSAETGKQYGIVIDFLDQFDPGFKRNAQVRKKHYAKHGWRQVMPERAHAQFGRQMSLFD